MEEKKIMREKMAKEEIPSQDGRGLLRVKGLSGRIWYDS